MKQQQLYRTAFFLAAIGLTLMYTSTFLQPQKVEISEVKPSMAGEKIQVSGTVEDPSGQENFFFKISGVNSSLKAIKFNAIPSFAEGENVTVTGEVTMYQGEMEIIADEIRPQ